MARDWETLAGASDDNFFTKCFVKVESAAYQTVTACDYVKFAIRCKLFRRVSGRAKDYGQREAPEGFKHQSWCVKKEGTTGLMRSLGRQIDVRVYNVLSHFAHGSVWAMQMLDGRIEDPEEMFATLIDSTYTRYLNSSRAFVRFVWQPLTTPEGEECKNDFVQVMSEHIKGTT